MIIWTSVQGKYVEDNVTRVSKAKQALEILRIFAGPQDTQRLSFTSSNEI